MFIEVQILPDNAARRVQNSGQKESGRDQTNQRSLHGGYH